MSIPFNKSILYYILKVYRCVGDLESLHKRQVCGSNYNSVSFIDIMQPQVQHILKIRSIAWYFIQYCVYTCWLCMYNTANDSFNLSTIITFTPDRNGDFFSDIKMELFSCICHDWSNVNTNTIMDKYIVYFTLWDRRWTRIYRNQCWL